MKTQSISPHIIYGLFDPNTDDLRYIGYTSNARERFRAHHKPSSLKMSTHKNNWIKSLLIQNKKAGMFILETYESSESLPQAEIELVEYYKSIGANLTNSTNGGDGIHKGHKLSEKHKKKISESLIGNTRTLGHKHSDERKKKISEFHKGNTYNLGRKHSDESKLKHSKNRIGKKTKPLSDEAKSKLSIINTGKKLSEETKQKISKSGIGRKHSDESKKKMSNKLKGKKSWRKTHLTDEQMLAIKSDTRSMKNIARKYKIHVRRIKQIRES